MGFRTNQNPERTVPGREEGRGREARGACSQDLKREGLKLETLKLF